MKAITVCVDYGDLLAITLPYNRHHFDRIVVVTSPEDKETISVATQHNAEVYTTSAFYENGASFNKWKALEEGLDVLGRDGLIAIMDADILWPKMITLEPESRVYPKGCLFTPYRYIWDDITKPHPPEKEWHRLPLFREDEFAGYTQIFHGDSPHLAQTPWHQTNWRHAGGADSFFQYRWPDSQKVRPWWRCLHLGPPCRNWMGRTTCRVDGTIPEQASQRLGQMMGMLQGRALLSRAGHPNPYAPELLPTPPNAQT